MSEDMTSPKPSKAMQSPTTAAGPDAATSAKLAPARSRLMSLISHDMRTPLSAISLAVQIMENTPGTPERAQCLRILKSSAQELLELADVMLDCSVIEAGEAALEPKRFDIRALLRRVVMAQEARVRDKPVTVDAEVDPRVPAYLEGDSTKLAQILASLIRNAIRRTAAGSVEVALSVAQANGETLSVRFSVKDGDNSSRPDGAELSFEALTEGNWNLALKYGSAELAYAVSRKWLQLQGTDIAVSAPAGGATTVSFLLRLKPAAGAD